LDKLKALNKITREIKECKICPIQKSGKPVPGEGNPDAKIVFMGEAPGKNEAKTGRPFIGRSGQLLRRLITEIGLAEEDVYITSPVKYLPDRGTPTPQDIKHGMIHTQKQLNIIDPKVIVLLGASASQGVLGVKIPITKEHGKPIKKDGNTFYVTFHPSAALRFPLLKELIKKDFENLKSLIKTH
jgi:uracil-DNA glycosylase family 4